MEIYIHTKKSETLFATAENENEAAEKYPGYTTKYHNDATAEFVMQLDTYAANALDEASIDLSDCDPDLDEFEANAFRFIKRSEIDEIMLDELGNDEYVLGCFNASFIAPIFNLPVAAVEAIQKGEQYEAMGQIMLNNSEGMKELQRQYVQVKGYAHHFAHYDSNEYECTINGTNWLFFRVS